MAPDVRSYEFGSAAEDDSLLAGLRAGQLAVLAGGLVVAVLAVRVSSSAGGFAVGGLVVGTAAALSFWSVAGRSVSQWTPILLGWGARRLTRRTTQLSTAPLMGDGPYGAAQTPPDTLSTVRLIAAPVPAGDGRTIGILHDRRFGAYNAVLKVRGRSFHLADTPEKQRRLAAWGGVLAGLARASSPIHRLQWVERTVPEDGDAMGRYLASRATAPTDHPSLASYLELVDRAGPAAPQHETLLAVSVSRSAIRRAVLQAGRGDEAAVTVLLRELGALRRQLASAEIRVDGVLTPRLLAGALRTAFEPRARTALARRAAAAGDEGGTDPANAWPIASDVTWSSYRTEDVWHATYWIREWPRTPVGADFLAPLLLGTVGMRTVSVTMEPVAPLRAYRQVEQQIVKSLADEELRTRAGFATTARRRRAQEAIAKREQELADGHVDYRLAGYVTVTAGSPEELDAACGEVEQAAQQAFLELRRLYGQQDMAFTWTLPLARGLR